MKRQHSSCRRRPASGKAFNEALSVRHVTGKPLKFAGIGEKLNGIEEFHPERMAARILGMGDILGLVEEAQRGQERGGAAVEEEVSGLQFDVAQGSEAEDCADQPEKAG